MDPFLLTFLRFTLCAIPGIFFIAKPKDISYGVLLLYGALFGAGLWWIVNFAMFNGLSAGMSSIFLQFSAFFTILISWLILKEKINTTHIIGMVCSAMGLLMILNSSEERSTTAGILLVLMAALSWSLCNILIKIKKPDDMIAFIIWSSLFSSPVILLLTLLTKGLSPFEDLLSKLTWGASFSVFFQAYITTIFGYRIWNNLMKKYPASTVAPLSLIVPASGLLTSYLFLGEEISLFQLLAILLIFVGLAIFIMSSRLAELSVKFKTVSQKN